MIHNHSQLMETSTQPSQPTDQSYLEWQDINVTPIDSINSTFTTNSNTHLLSYRDYDELLTETCNDLGIPLH